LICTNNKIFKKTFVFGTTLSYLTKTKNKQKIEKTVMLKEEMNVDEKD